MDVEIDRECKLEIGTDYACVLEYFIFDNDTSNLIVKWKEKDSECQESLEKLIDTKETYLYHLIPWLLNLITNKTDEASSKMILCISNVWKSTASTIPVGSFVKLTDGSEIDMAYKIGIVVSHEQKLYVK